MSENYYKMTHQACAALLLEKDKRIALLEAYIETIEARAIDVVSSYMAREAKYKKVLGILGMEDQDHPNA